MCAACVCVCVCVLRCVRPVRAVVCGANTGLAKKLGVDNFFLTTHDAVDYMLAELEDHGLIKPHLPSTSTSPSPLSEDEPTTDSAASDTDSDEAQKKTPKSGVLARYAVDVDADGEGAADLERGATRARRW